MLKKSESVHPKFYAGLAGVAALALFTACSAEEPAQDEQPADQETEQQDDSAPADDQDTAAEDQTHDTGDDTASEDDEVYSIIDAVEAEYSDGFIIEIDRNDDGSTYEVDVVAEDQVYELDVAADGTINVDETESDEDDIREAEEATVTVTEALDEAFNEHPDDSFDEIELDEDDGSLHWEIEFDVEDGDDVEMEVPAS